jgi:hypothetical protein
MQKKHCPIGKHGVPRSVIGPEIAKQRLGFSQLRIAYYALALLQKETYHHFYNQASL